MKILIIDDEMAALTKMKVLLSAYGECVLSTNAGQAQQLADRDERPRRPRSPWRSGEAFGQQLGVAAHTACVAPSRAAV